MQTCSRGEDNYNSWELGIESLAFANIHLKRGDGRVVSKPGQLEGIGQGVGSSQVQVTER